MLKTAQKLIYKFPDERGLYLSYYIDLQVDKFKKLGENEQDWSYVAISVDIINKSPKKKNCSFVLGNTPRVFLEICNALAGICNKILN